MLLPFTPRRAHVRLATVASALVVLGALACNALPMSSPPGAPESTTTNLKAAPPPAPAAQPAAAGGATVGAPAPGVASDAAGPAPAQQRSAVAANSPAPNNSLPDTSAQILDRMVLRTAQLTVQITETGMESALAQARQIATRGGGFVS